MNLYEVRYLLVGGYAVAYHGYPRSTGDMDIWIARDETNSSRLSKAIQKFGISSEMAQKDLFMQENKVFRMGHPPVRLEIITSASGVDFEECYKDRETYESEGVSIQIISLNHLRKNKKASGRHKDLEDLQNLP